MLNNLYSVLIKKPNFYPSMDPRLYINSELLRTNWKWLLLVVRDVQAVKKPMTHAACDVYTKYEVLAECNDHAECDAHSVKMSMTHAACNVYPITMEPRCDLWKPRCDMWKPRCDLVSLWKLFFRAEAQMEQSAFVLIAVLLRRKNTSKCITAQLSIMMEIILNRGRSRQAHNI